MSTDAHELLERLAQIDGRAAVWCACQCVRTVLHLVPDDEDRPRRAIEVAEAWAQGKITTAACRFAVGSARSAWRSVDRPPRPRWAFAIQASSLVAAPDRAHEVVRPVVHAAGHDDQARDVEGVHERLVALIHAQHWPLEAPKHKLIRSASSAVAVAWDFLTSNGRIAHTIPELVEAHARAQRLGLDWSNSVQRAIAERALDEGRVRELLTAEARFEQRRTFEIGQLTRRDR